jgi:hypothetical protein
MKTNKTYQSLLDKSINSMLSAIEIYNKTNFSYREETFAILSVNSWELLFKAYLLKRYSYNLNSLYKMEFIVKKNGENSKRRKPSVNRTGNPMTISIYEAIAKIEKIDQKFSPNLKASVEALIELRDNAIHFHNEKNLARELQQLGFACIKNYITIIKKWDLEIKMSKYNLHLMPLAYVDSNVQVKGMVTEEVKNYLNFINQKVQDNSSRNDEFSVAISVDINFKKSNSLDGLHVQYDKNGTAVTISEEDMRQKFPLTYNDVTTKLKERYDNCKMDKIFHELMKSIKENDKLYHFRKLDTAQEKSSGKGFYSNNIWQELDKHYNKPVKPVDPAQVTIKF